MGITTLASIWGLAGCAWLTMASPIGDASSHAAISEQTLVVPAAQPARLIPPRGPASEPARQYASSQPSPAMTRSTDEGTSGQNTRPTGTATKLVEGALAGSSAPWIGGGGAGRQASEAAVSASSLLTTGAAAVAAPQPTTLTTVNSIRGIQRGYAVGLGFAHHQNVLTWQRNPADRPCQELVRAGFWPGTGMCGRRR